MIRTARIYDQPSRRDGYRLLVMRMWPRGVRKDAVDDWQKELGPSTALFRAYRAGRVGWAEFARRYRAEMRVAAGYSRAVELNVATRQASDGRYEPTNQRIFLAERLTLPGDKRDHYSILVTRPRVTGPMPDAVLRLAGEALRRLDPGP